MDYLDWLNEEKKKRLNKKLLYKRSSSGSKQLVKIKNFMAVANSLYVKNDFYKCIEVLKEVIRLSPKNSHAYFTLGLIFEERGEFTEAYHCFLVTAYLQKNNYELWRKLYDYSRILGYERERIYFIEVLQKKDNNREMIIEKMNLYCGNKLKELMCRIELFEFDGVDDNIFTDIYKETNHKARIGRLSRMLYRYLLKNGNKCSNYYIEQLIKLKYQASSFNNLKTIFDKYLLTRTEIDIELRTIYIIASVYNGNNENISKFINDEEWHGIRNIEILKDLADMLTKKKLFNEAIRLLNEMNNVFNEHKESICWKLGNIFKRMHVYDEALLYYNLVLTINPVNDIVKTQIYSIYFEQGKYEMAKKYETINQVVGIIKDFEQDYKRNKYSLDMCTDMKTLYENTKGLAKENIKEFLKKNKLLVNDFFENKFLFKRSKKSRSNILKPDKIIKASGAQAVRINTNFIDLHGLNVNEWFNVIINQVFSLITIGKIDEALEIIFKSLRAYAFEYRIDLLMRLSFVGLKVTFLFGKFDEFILLIKNLISSTGN